MPYIWARKSIVGGTVSVISDLRAMHGQGQNSTVAEVEGHHDVGVDELLRKTDGDWVLYIYVKPNQSLIGRLAAGCDYY